MRPRPLRRGQPHPLRTSDIERWAEEGDWPIPYGDVRAVVNYESRQTLRRLPWCSTLTIEDLTQEAWLRALKARDKYDPDRRFRFTSMLIRYVRNRLIDIMRSEWKRTRTNMVPIEEAADVPSDSGEDDRHWDELEASFVRADVRARHLLQRIRLERPVLVGIDPQETARAFFSLKRRAKEVLGV